MPIEGLSEIRRFPRAGIIRLGVRVKTNKPCKCEGKEKSCFLCMGTGIIHRPKEVDHFVCPKIVQKEYGPEPKRLKILIPVEEEGVFFRQYLYSYGNGVLLCRGNGINGTFFNFEIGDYDTRKCPCEKLERKECDKAGILQFLLPEVKEAAGVWQITTHSRNSIIDINSGISFVRGIAGRIKFIPLWLIREEIKTSKLGKNGVIKGRHWTLKFSLEGMSLMQLQEFGQKKAEQYFLPSPVDTVPEDSSPENGNGENIQDMKEQEGINEAQEIKEPESTEVPNDTPKDEEMLKLEADLQVIIEKYEEVCIATVPKSQIESLKTKKDFEKTIAFYKSRINKVQPGLFKESA